MAVGELRLDQGAVNGKGGIGAEMIRPVYSAGLFIQLVRGISLKTGQLQQNAGGKPGP